MKKKWIILGIIPIFEVCSPPKRIGNYSVTTFEKVDWGYHYSKDMFQYHGAIYRPFERAEYANDTLISVGIYKSEGAIRYTKAELMEDLPLMKSFGIPNERVIYLHGEQLRDNKISYPTTEIRGDSIFCCQRDSLFLYVVH
jgi:hypothetical protein